MGFLYIYFFGTETGGEVKVGHTKQAPNFRRMQHENHSGHDVPMRTLAVVLGQRADEEALKHHFAPHRSRPRSREWFTAGAEIRAYLRWLRDLPFVARDDNTLARLSPVDASEWLPNGSRGKEARQLRLADADGWPDPWADLQLDHIMEGDYYTPGVLIEAARDSLGEIDLDPASCSEANDVVQARQFFSFHENGLTRDWGGRVWLNPPYGNWPDWAPKVLHELDSGRIDAMCLLSTTRSITAQSFHPLVRRADAMFVANGRYRFWGPKAKEPDEGHVIFYYGQEPERFAAAYSPLGTVFARRLS